MPEPLKNMYNDAYFETLTKAMLEAHTSFDKSAFLAAIHDDTWANRELKDRMRHITITLRQFLPPDYPEALRKLRDAASQLDNLGFGTMIFPDFVEMYGLDDWDSSLPALEQFTQQSSAEFAVRPFILQDQERMMAQMLTWAQHENHHLRRLASEGCRPRLPWAIALPPFKADPSPILPILETLKTDESEYVRRSVANNLNDIAKDSPDVVLAVLRDWSEHDTAEMDWMIRHALRTLIKAGNTQALALIGFDAEPQILVENLTITPSSIAIGEAVTFAFGITSQAEKPQSLMIDTVVHLVRARGKTSEKVFKLTQREIQPGETIHIQRKQSFQPVTTRRYYPGQHAIEIQINGQRFAKADFVLMEAAGD